MDPGLRAQWAECLPGHLRRGGAIVRHTGALIVLERNTNLSEIIRTGTPLNGDVNREMLGTIFYEGTPLHDGAVAVRDGMLKAAGCVLPLSDNLEIGKDMGTRHRAALGMSENSDAVVVVVSEETGIISLARNGVLIRRLDRQNLFNMLQEELVSAQQQETPKNLLSGEKRMKKDKDKSLLDDRRFSIPPSILLAVALWMVVTMVINPNQSTTIYNVPVDFTYNSTSYTSKGLDIVNNPQKNVSLKLEGNGDDLSGLKAEDFVVHRIIPR